MLLINKSARLITINHEGEKYRLIPAGKPVAFPSDKAEGCKFLQILVKDGNVDILDGPDKSEAKEPDPLEGLRDEAEGLGITVDKRWGEAKLKEAIDAAKAEAAKAGDENQDD